MDATDYNEDVKLYRASGDLLPEIDTKLPLLLWPRLNGGLSLEIRRWIPDTKAQELINLVRNLAASVASSDD